MSYRLINANELAIKYPEVNDMPCIYADLPKGLDGRYYGLTKRMQRWIPVSERLPEIDEIVLVTWNNVNGLYVNKMRHEMDGLFIDHYGDEHEAGEITAWMPLPKPYKAGEGKE